MKPAGHKFTPLKQICDLIPRNLVAKLSAKHGVDKLSFDFVYRHFNEESGDRVSFSELVANPRIRSCQIFARRDLQIYP